MNCDEDPPPTLMGLDESLGAVSPQTLGMARNCEEDPPPTLMGIDGSLGAVSPQTLGLARKCEEDPPPTLKGLLESLGGACPQTREVVSNDTPESNPQETSGFAGTPLFWPGAATDELPGASLELMDTSMLPISSRMLDSSSSETIIGFCCCSLIVSLGGKLEERSDIRLGMLNGEMWVGWFQQWVGGDSIGDDMTETLVCCSLAMVLCNKSCFDAS